MTRSNGGLRHELASLRSREARMDCSASRRNTRAIRRSYAGDCTAVQGLTMRTAIKRAVMTAYCWGLVPAWLVDFVFRVFRLKHA